MAVFDSLLSRIAEQDQRIADLEARLKLNSTNSSKPPSSDPIGLKRKPPAPPTGRQSGGQPGHAKAQRPLVPPEKLRSSTDCRPGSCRRCAHALQGDDPAPLIHQVADLPRIEPIVDQFRLHRLTCSHCGATTCGTLPAGVPTGSFSPYTQAVLATLAGAYRLSKRQIQQLAGDLFGLTISTGMISKLEKQSAQALAAPYHELARSVTEAEAVNIDETGWREDRRKAWLWVTVTASATVFSIAGNRSAEVARGLLGDKEDQVVSSDRFKSYDWLWAYWRQICWSHLRRDFQAMIDRGGAGEATGRRLLGLSDRLFAAWHKARDGTPEECRFQAADPPLEAPGAPRLGGRHGVRLRDDGPDLRRDPTCGRGPVEFRVVRRSGADEQRGGTGLAPCGDLAADQRWYGERVGEPVRGADADGGGHLPATGPQRAGVPDLVL